MVTTLGLVDRGWADTGLVDTSLVDTGWADITLVGLGRKGMGLVDLGRVDMGCGVHYDTKHSLVDCCGCKCKVKHGRTQEFTIK